MFLIQLIYRCLCCILAIKNKEVNILKVYLGTISTFKSFVKQPNLVETHSILCFHLSYFDNLSRLLKNKTTNFRYIK